MHGGSSKLGRGGGRGGGGPVRNRNSFPLPNNRHPSPVGRMSSGAAPRQRTTTSVKPAASPTIEETYNLVSQESNSEFGMLIRLTPDMVEEIERVEADGRAAKIKFDALPNNSSGNMINVSGKEFKYTWYRESGDLCDIYEEHQSGEDGNGVLLDSGCAWRKLNVQRTLDDSTTNHVKMRSVEAELRAKSRKSIVLDNGNPSLNKKVALAEASQWRMSNKQKKEPPPKKRKVDPPPVPSGGPKPSVRPGASTPAVKPKLLSPPGPSPPNQHNTPPSYGIGNTAKTYAVSKKITPVQSKGRENVVASEKDPMAKNMSKDTSGLQATNVSKEIDLQTLLVDLLKEAPMTLKALEKAVGDRIPNASKKIEPILKNISNFQAPRYFLKPDSELESDIKHSPDRGSSPEHQKLLPITECSRDKLPVPGDSNMENGEGSQDCLPVQLAEQMNAQENVDMEHNSPGILHEEKRSENRESQAPSSSDSDNSDSVSDSGSSKGSDSGSSNDSEASSSSKDDSDVDIMSDGVGEPQQIIHSAERDAIDLPYHGTNAVDIDGHDSDAVDIDGHDSEPVDIDGYDSNVVDIEGHDSEPVDIDGYDSNVVDIEGHDSDPVDIDGHDSDAIDIDGHGSDAVDIEGNSSDEGHSSEVKRRKISDNNCKMEATTGTIPAVDKEVCISGQEKFASGHEKLRERNNLIGQLFDDTENSTKDNLINDQPDIPKGLAKEQNKKASDLAHYSQKSARAKNIKSQSFNKLPGKDSQHSERTGDGEHLGASASQTIDPLSGLQKSSIEKSKRHGQMKPVDRSGKSNKQLDVVGNVRKSDEGDHFPDQMLSSRSGKPFRGNQRDDVHLKNKFPRNKNNGEPAIQPSVHSDTSNRKQGELSGSDKDPKTVSGLRIGSSPLDSQKTHSMKLPRGNGPMLQKQVSELELGELPEAMDEDTSLKQFEEKTTARQSNKRPNTSENLGIDLDKRRSKKPDSRKPALSNASNGIKENPEHLVGDSERSQKWALQSHGQNSRERVGNSVEGYGETNKKTPDIKVGSKRPSTSRSSRESKRHASGTVANSINGHKDATSTPSGSVVREKQTTSFDEEDAAYMKYDKASPELKGPINDYSQYKAYMQEYLDKYGSYCSINKILESYRNEFEKLGKDLEFAKGRGDMERYHKIREQIKESNSKYGERHKRLKKVFIILHEELTQVKQKMKEYASSHG